MAVTFCALPLMYSVVVTSAVAPFQLPLALMPKRLNDGVPSAWRISLRPHPVSSAACETMKLAGMPVLASASRAAAVCCCTKPRAPACGMRVACGVADSGAAVLLAEPVTGMGPGLRPIWRSSCFMIASDRPPGRPASCVASWLSSISVPMARPDVAPLSSISPLCKVVLRMLFMSSFMKRVSNCLAASLTAALGSAAARERSASSERLS